MQADPVISITYDQFVSIPLEIFWATAGTIMPE